MLGFRCLFTAAVLSIAALQSIDIARAADRIDAGHEARPFLQTSDNRLSFSTIFNATGPGHWSRLPDGEIDGTTTKQAYSFTHADTWDYGSNYLDVTLYRSGPNDPARPCLRAGVVPAGAAVSGNCPGETEIYVILRSTLGWNELFKTKAFARRPLKDVSFLVGGDANHQNDFNGGSKRALVAGLKMDFELPNNGALSIAPMMYYEFANRSRFIRCTSDGGVPGVTCTQGGKKHFRPTWAVEISYRVDADFLQGSAGYFGLSGRVSLRGPKGNQNAPLGKESGGHSTTIEINSEPVRLTFDASRAFAGREHAHDVDIWVAYRYWKNKFGIDASASPTCFTDRPGESNKSCTESSIVTGITVKL
jgi:hypothetical protein